MEDVVISGAVEGLLDEAVLRRLVDYAGAGTGPVHGKNGKQFLRQKLPGYDNAARFAPWLVLVDLNQDAECAPALRQVWLPQPAPYMCFRISVRKLEAWLLADAEELARFLSIPLKDMPDNPESLTDPKSLRL